MTTTPPGDDGFDAARAVERIAAVLCAVAFLILSYCSVRTATHSETGGGADIGTQADGGVKP